MRYRFHPEAAQEYFEAVLYYKEISSELSNAFTQSVDKGIYNIIENATTWPIIEDNVRRHLIDRFPYGIYYTIESRYILIVAVMHMSRKPGYWKNRLI